MDKAKSPEGHPGFQAGRFGAVDGGTRERSTAVVGQNLYAAAKSTRAQPMEAVAAPVVHAARYSFYLPLVKLVGWAVQLRAARLRPGQSLGPQGVRRRIVQAMSDDPDFEHLIIGRCTAPEP